MAMEHFSAHVRPLNDDAPDGLFLGPGECPFWIFTSSRDRVAVQMQSNEYRPAFAFNWLDRTPITRGVWLGPVLLCLGPPSSQVHRGGSGIIVQKGDRYYLKANERYNKSEWLMLAAHPAPTSSKQSLFYLRWKVKVDQGPFESLALTYDASEWLA